MHDDAEMGAQEEVASDHVPRVKKRKPRALKNRPWIGDPEAKAKLAAAAAAVGLELSELADMMVDSGIAAPPTDEITQKYTLEDLGKRLWGCLQEQPKTKRQEWFDELTPMQQNSLIVVLRDRGFHFEVIANEFAIPVKQVINTWNQYCDELGSQVVGVRLETIAGQLQSHASRAQHMAVEAGDHKGFWKISSEYIGMLQGLGIVDRAIHRVDHQITHKFEDQRKVEIDAMVALERKKEARFGELKQIEAVVADTPPQLVEDYDDDQETP